MNLMLLCWTWLCAETEVRRFLRIVKETRAGQGRIDDGIWIVQRFYVLSCLLSAAMIWWSVAGAIRLHSLWWAVPTVVLVAWFWAYMLAATRGVVETLRERKMWITAERWGNVAGQE